MKTLEFLNKISDNQKESSHIQGWLFPPEAFILYSLSLENIDAAGKVLEIGSFMGKSSYWLAKGAKERNGEKIICIDTFEGSIEHQDALKGRSTYVVFEENLRRAGVFDWVMPVRKSSSDAFASFNEKISLLFIDGSHEYDDVKADLLNWEQRLIKGGIVILHDSAGQWAGPTKAADELIIGRKHTYKDVIRIESMTIAEKRI
ncbi:MAG: class I SAM-dependent methyltransferase [Desulfobacteraceae bacterium]|jgi:predicted O-methyltransferase YrrM